MNDTKPQRTYSSLELFGLIMGLIAVIVPLFTAAPEGLSLQGWRLIGITLLMAFWWIFSTIHISATALIPLIAFPLLHITDAKSASEPYASPVVFLLLGGFIIASALQKWQLHRRIALTVATKCGKKIDRVILGFMITVACLSMWISNTASTLLMLTIASSLIETLSKKHHLPPDNNPIGTAMMLGIAYSASIGGIGTIVGTAPNAFLVEFLTNQPYNIEISFISWMSIALPCVLTLIPITWFILTHVIFRECVNPKFLILPQSQESMQDDLNKMGLISTPEKRVSMVFLAVALGWMTRPLLNKIHILAPINDASIGIIGAIALFLIPSGDTTCSNDNRLLSWEDTNELPWGVLILLGGGLSLASAVSSTDLASWLGMKLSMLENLQINELILLFSASISLLTEMTSNTATTATFVPIITAFAQRSGIDPLLLAMPVTLTASCAFMLPIATPPNALIFSTPYVTVAKMAKAGFAINIIAVIIICTISPWVITLAI